MYKKNVLDKFERGALFHPLIHTSLIHELFTATCVHMDFASSRGQFHYL